MIGVEVASGGDDETVIDEADERGVGGKELA